MGSLTNMTQAKYLFKVLSPVVTYVEKSHFTTSGDQIRGDRKT